MAEEQVEAYKHFQWFPPIDTPVDARHLARMGGVNGFIFSGLMLLGILLVFAVLQAGELGKEELQGMQDLSFMLFLAMIVTAGLSWRLSLGRGFVSAGILLAITVLWTLGLNYALIMASMEMYMLLPFIILTVMIAGLCIAMAINGLRGAWALYSGKVSDPARRQGSFHARSSDTHLIS